MLKTKDGGGSATLSMAFTGQLFTTIAGEPNIVECSFFATPVRLEPNGMQEVLPFGPLSPSEQVSIDCIIPDLITQTQK